MTPDLQGRVCSPEPIGIAASMCKTDPPDVRFDVTFVYRFSVTHTVSDHR